MFTTDSSKDNKNRKESDQILKTVTSVLRQLRGYHRDNSILNPYLQAIPCNLRSRPWLLPIGQSTQTTSATLSPLVPFVRFLEKGDGMGPLCWPRNTSHFTDFRSTRVKEKALRGYDWLNSACGEICGWQWAISASKPV